MCLRDLLFFFLMQAAIIIAIKCYLLSKYGAHHGYRTALNHSLTTSADSRDVNSTLFTDSSFYESLTGESRVVESLDSPSQ